MLRAARQQQKAPLGARVFRARQPWAFR